MLQRACASAQQPLDGSGGNRQHEASTFALGARPGGGYTISQEGGRPMTAPQGRELATLGGGCFWCLEAVYKDLKGVERVVSGYAGGHLDNPTYEQVCGGRTGHAEVVQITYDPAVVSYPDLLDVFFTIHDPTTKDQQGADIGPQYRSIILYHSPEQKADAERAIAAQGENGVWDAPVVTEVVPLERF